MKKILFTLALLFAIAAPSYGQLTPGPGFEHNPGLPPSCTPDLYIYSVGALPTTANPGDVISIPVTVRNTNECNTTSSNLRVQIEYRPYQYHFVNVTVPPFSSTIVSHTVVAKYVVSPISSGGPIFLVYIGADSNSQISESNEMNNAVSFVGSIHIN